MKYRVSIVEDHEQTALSLTEIIDNSEDFTVWKRYGTGEEALNDVPRNTPDLLIMDLGLPGIDGAECISRLREELPDLKIIVLTVFEDDDHILRSLEAGANGYLLKDIDPPLLLAELRVMQLGGGPMSPVIARKIMDKYVGATGHCGTSAAGEVQGKRGKASGKEEAELLSPRERQVIELVSLGFVYTDIADELDISPHTVRRHIENIYGKLNVHSRSEAIIKSRRFGILDNPSI